VTPEPLPAASPLAPDDLADLAVAAGDEHAIKLTEARLRLHAETPDPVSCTRPPAPATSSAAAEPGWLRQRAAHSRLVAATIRLRRRGRAG
jgi:hypothetical protein